MRIRIAAVVCVTCAVLSLLADEPASATIPPPKAKSATVSFTDIGLVEFDAPEEGCVIRYTLNGSTPNAKSFAYCTPLRVASSLKLKAACFKADGTSSAPVEVECTRNAPDKKEPGAKPSAAINVDFSQTPDLKDWALRAQKDADEYYPVIAEKLSGEGFEAPRQITFIFIKAPKGIAYTVDKTITFVEGWIQAHPKDTGTVIHELTHVIQAYKGKVPGWLTEGIADYIRWWNWEPATKRGRVDPLHAKYTNGYNDTAAFLFWIESTYDKQFVNKINQDLRKGTYDDELFNKYAGKHLPELWTEFIASLHK